jgi:hypothetical protein
LNKHFWALFRINRYSLENPGKLEKFIAACRNFRDRAVQDELGLEIGRAAGLLGPKDTKKVFPVIVKAGIVEQARMYTAAHLDTIMRMLLAFELDIKTGRVEPVQQVFEIFCYKIMKVGEPGFAEYAQ